MRSPDTDHLPGDSTEDLIEAAAVAWIARRDRGFSAAEAKGFASWKDSDPRHAAAWARVSATWRGLDGMKADSELSAMARSIRARAEARRDRRLAYIRFSVGLCAAAAVLALAFFWRAHSSSAAGAEHYQVIASAARKIALPDGSVAELNGDSRIETSFTAAERRVRLVAGEAHFIVAKDAARPFFVSAGPVVVRAVGTAFNVRLDSSAVDVLITEGKVRVDTRTEGVADSRPPEANLVAGQRGTFDVSRPAPVMAVVTPKHDEVDEALAWRTTRLVFKDTSLDEVIRAFNQHNHRKFVLGDAKLTERKLTGVFRADNVNGFVSLLEGTVDVRTELRSPDEIILWPARP